MIYIRGCIRYPVTNMKVVIEAKKIWTKKTDKTGRISGLPSNTVVVVAIESGQKIPPQIKPPQEKKTIRDELDIEDDIEEMDGEDDFENLHEK